MGIDINRDAISYIKSNIKYDNVIYGDIVGEKINDISKETWDYAVLGEILEHVDNPVYFLSKLKTNYQNYIDKIIITVPNMYSYTNISLIKRGVEKINSDHRYWFSPFTLAKVLTRSGYSVEDVFYADPPRVKRRSIKKLFLGRERVDIEKQYSSTLIAIARL